MMIKHEQDFVGYFVSWCPTTSFSYVLCELRRGLHVARLPLKPLLGGSARPSPAAPPGASHGHRLGPPPPRPQGLVAPEAPPPWRAVHWGLRPPAPDAPLPHQPDLHAVPHRLAGRFTRQIEARSRGSLAAIARWKPWLKHALRHRYGVGARARAVIS